MTVVDEQSSDPEQETKCKWWCIEPDAADHLHDGYGDKVCRSESETVYLSLHPLGAKVIPEDPMLVLWLRGEDASQDTIELDVIPPGTARLCPGEAGELLAAMARLLATAAS